MIPTTHPRFARAFLVFAIVSSFFGSGFETLSIGQEPPLAVGRSAVSSETPMNYSSENPEWLTFVAGKNKSGTGSWWPSWKLPSWKKSGTTGWWTSEKKASSYSRSNKTTMQKISQTSKRWWNNTLEFLDPYAPPKERPNSSQSDPGFFGKLFGPKDTGPKFNSVPEWAGQPMPK